MRKIYNGYGSYVKPQLFGLRFFEKILVCSTCRTVYAICHTVCHIIYSVCGAVYNIFHSACRAVGYIADRVAYVAAC